MKQSSFRSAIARLIGTLALLVPAVAAAATHYDIETIDRPGAAYTSFWDINNAGLVTGHSLKPGAHIQTGFVYDSHTGVFTDVLGPSGAVGSSTTGISDAGAIVGNYWTSYWTSVQSPTWHSFIYELGAYTEFSVAGASDTVLRGISPDNRYLSGYYTNATGSLFGFIFDRQASLLIDLGPDVLVQGINGHDVAAGSDGFQPFLYDIASAVRTDYTPATGRYRDVNIGGIIAGFDVSGYNKAIVGVPGGMLTVLEPAGSIDSIAYGINDAGTVVGFYDDDLGATRAFIATVVPEPGTGVLAVLGLVALAARLRRRDR